VTTGTRRGELLALQWKHLDLAAGSLQVVGTLQRTKEGLSVAEPKTDKSRRQVALSTTAVQALKKHRAIEASQQLLLGAA
jgi:integrase